MASTYTPIATTTGNGSSAIISFTSIPSTYTDLILVQNGNASSNGNDISITFNSDTATNYSRTYVLGNGTAASSGRTTSANYFAPNGAYFDSNTIIQIMNYANTTTYKTAIARGTQSNAYTSATVGLWRSTAAINRIDVACSGYWTTAATFTLYGIKAA